MLGINMIILVMFYSRLTRSTNLAGSRLGRLRDPCIPPKCYAVVQASKASSKVGFLRKYSSLVYNKLIN